jgi:predicted AlkP superfamily phosphohydrolase/phosphomutase
MPARVLCLALDAADKDLILRWAAEGKLPTFRRLLERNPWAMTASPPGVFPGAIWSSFLTGASPARHGRFATHQIRKGTYRLRGFTPNHLRVEPFWESLSRSGARVAVIDVPKAPLSDGLNGIQVVEWGVHDFDLGFRTWPRDLAAELTRRFGSDPVGLCDRRRTRTVEEVVDFRDALLRRIEMKTEMLLHLLGGARWDLFMAAFSEPHCAGHQAWHVHDPGHPDHDRKVAAAAGDPLEQVYVGLDSALASLLAAGDAATTLVIATHGFGPQYDGSHLLDEILRRMQGVPQPPDRSILVRVSRSAWRRLPRRFQDRTLPFARALVDRTSLPLDESRPYFAVPNNHVCGAIRINVAGREPRGVVQPGSDYEVLCDEIAEELCTLVNAETGKRAVERVWRTKEVYEGPLVDELPDLIVDWNHAAPVRAVESPRIGRVEDLGHRGRTGDHRPEGLFVVDGTNVPPGRIGERSSITDFAPTIAAWFGVPLREVDGKPIGWCLDRRAATSESLPREPPRSAG